jgi:hypothetical protein
MHTSTHTYSQNACLWITIIFFTFLVVDVCQDLRQQWILERILEVGVVETRRTMHLCVKGDLIEQKFMGLAPADMDRLPHLINTKKFLVVNDLVCQLGLQLLSTCLVLQGKSPVFMNTFSF